jgi:hypothetical protein
MSGNRANAAAIQRRTMGAQSNVAPPGTSRPQQQQQMRPQMQQQQMRPQQQQMRPQQQQMQQQQPMQNPKLSVSDAIGLITLRLGRVETFIQQMPPLDQIGMNATGEHQEIGENMRVVDEAVFTNIVSRLDKLEQEPKTSNVVASKETNTAVTELKESVEVLKAEMMQMKGLLLSLQSFTMQTNQKLSELIFNSQQENENENDSEHEDDVQEELDANNEEQEENDDSEIVAENIDLKAFVQSAL